MFSRKGRVSFSQTDENRRMKLGSIVDVMQDLSCEHSDSLGVGRDALMQIDRGWLLNSWQIIIDRYPTEGVHYTAETRPWKFEKFFGHRNFALIDENGEYMVRANSLWFCVDTAKMRPVLPGDEIIGAYEVDERLPMEYAAGRKLSVPKELTAYEDFPVRRTQLDYNHHVNNGRYIDMAMEYFPADGEIAELRVEYRSAARYGDRIVPKVGADEDGWITVVLESTDGSIYVILKGRLR